MARRDDLIAFAQLHGLKVATIADLIAYRRRHDRIVERKIETEFDSDFGGTFRMIVYVNKVAYAEHIALVKGDVSSGEPVLVRMHALNVLDDVLGSKARGRSGVLQAALDIIGRAGRGVAVLIREPTPTALSDRVRRMTQHQNERVPELRDYGIGAQILLDLGVREMILLSNTTRTIVGLEGYGLSVVERRPIPGVGGD
jgi:3,4-dihydroxy 2-butanone 4-phosphate synthase/GTP cyclohydrolase II